MIVYWHDRIQNDKMGLNHEGKMPDKDLIHIPDDLTRSGKSPTRFCFRNMPHSPECQHTSDLHRSESSSNLLPAPRAGSAHRPRFPLRGNVFHCKENERCRSILTGNTTGV